MPVLVGALPYEVVYGVSAALIVHSVAELTRVGAEVVAQSALVRLQAGERLVVVNGESFEGLPRAFFGNVAGGDDRLFQELSEVSR
jgi:hypothetical protein